MITAGRSAVAAASRSATSAKTVVRPVGRSGSAV